MFVCLFLFLFFFFSHILSLCLTAKEKHSSFSFLSHTNYLSRGLQHFALSSLAFFSSYFSFPYSSPWLFSQSGIILLCPSWLSSLLLSFFHVTLIGYFLKGGNTLLSPPWLSSSRRQHFALSSLPISLKVATLWFLLPGYLLSKNLFFLSWFHTQFSLSP